MPSNFKSLKYKDLKYRVFRVASKKLKFLEAPFTDDFMFRKVMEDKGICKRMLEILLDIKIDHIENLTPDFTIENVFNSHGVRLDVYVKDSDRVFDVEMQTAVKGDEGLRARYYQGEIDMNLLSRGQRYKQLKESYIIFLCTQDPFGQGMPVYYFETLCRGANYIKINDRVNKYFFNASAADKVTDNEEVKNLLSYTLEMIEDLKTNTNFMGKKSKETSLVHLLCE